MDEDIDMEEKFQGERAGWLIFGHGRSSDKLLYFYALTGRKCKQFSTN